MSKKEKEIIVTVQRMFPNCEKYKKCCVESGYEETMKKVKKVSNYEEMLKDIEEAFGGRK
jgi:hypothetical protein